MQHYQHGDRHNDENHYLRLAVMIVLSFMSMYVLIYAMANTLGDVYQSLNQVYMVGLMTAPMVVIELLLMCGMYKNKRLNVLLVAGSCMAGIAFLLFIRQQLGIEDHQFFKGDDPATLWRNPHVSGGVDRGSESQGPLQDDHRWAAGRDRPDAGAPPGGGRKPIASGREPVRGQHACDRCARRRGPRGMSRQRQAAPTLTRRGR